MVIKAFSPIGQEATRPRRATKHDVAALALSDIFKGWMTDKKEAIAKREEKRRREKETICNQL
jgi:hypothetical protein